MTRAFDKTCAPSNDAIGEYDLIGDCGFPDIGWSPPDTLTPPTDPPIPIPPVDQGCFPLAIDGQLNVPGSEESVDGGFQADVTYADDDYCKPNVHLVMDIPCFVTFGGETTLSVVYDPRATSPTAEVAATGTDECDFGLDMAMTLPCPVVVSTEVNVADNRKIPRQPTLTLSANRVVEFGGDSSSNPTCDYMLQLHLDMPCPVEFVDAEVREADVTDESYYTGSPTGGPPERRWAHEQPTGRVVAVPSGLLLEGESSSYGLPTDCVPKLVLELNLPCPTDGFHKIPETAVESALLVVRQAMYDGELSSDAALHPYYDKVPGGTINIRRDQDVFATYEEAQAANPSAHGEVARLEFDENCLLKLDFDLFVPCERRELNVAFYDQDGSLLPDWGVSIAQEWDDAHPENCAHKDNLQIFVGTAATEVPEANRPVGEIVCYGPSGEDPLTNEDYWVQMGSLVPDGDGFEVDTTGGEIVQATNILERPAGTHGLEVGTPVELQQRYDTSNNPHWVFAATPIILTVLLGGAYSAYGAERDQGLVTLTARTNWSFFWDDRQGETDYNLVGGNDIAVYKGETYKAGSFGFGTSFGGAPLARWNRVTGQWDPLLPLGSDPSGHGATGVALYVWDDGSGEKLYISVRAGTGGSAVSSVIAYDGASFTDTDWSTDVGTTIVPLRLYASDVGGTSYLYAVGGFSSGSGQGVARYNGSSWSYVGFGKSGETTNVYAIIEYDGYLFVAGEFAYCDATTTADNVAKFDGSTWTEGGGGLAVGGDVASLEVFSGCLYAGAVGGSSSNCLNKLTSSTSTWEDIELPLKRWNSSGGSASIAVANINDLCAHEGRLYLGGEITSRQVQLSESEVVGSVATFDDPAGSGYGSTVWQGLTEKINQSGGAVYAMAEYGSYVAVGGSFSVDGANNVGLYDKSTGELLAMGAGTNGVVYALAVHNGVLYAGGEFSQAGTATGVGNLAAWDDGSSDWDAVGSGTDGRIRALLSSSTLGELVLAGDFDTVGGGAGHICLSSYNDSTLSFTSLNHGIAEYSGASAFIAAMCEIDGYLYVGGNFVQLANSGPSSVDVNNVARLDLTSLTWSALADEVVGSGDGILGVVYSVAAKLASSIVTVVVGCEAASKPESMPGSSASGLWKWFDNSGIGSDDLWDDISTSSFCEPVYALIYDSSDSYFYFGGCQTSGSTSAYRVARTSGSSIQYLGGSDGYFDGTTFSLLRVGADLWAGGDFVRAGKASSTAYEARQLLTSIDADDNEHLVKGGLGTFPYDPINAITESITRMLSTNVGTGTDSSSAAASACNQLMILTTSAYHNDGYSTLVVGINRREEYVPIQGGLYQEPNGNIVTTVKDFAFGPNNEVLIVGYFVGAWNRYIKAADARDVAERIVASNVVRFDGKYFHKAGSNSLNGILAAAYYGDEYYVASDMVYKSDGDSAWSSALGTEADRPTDGSFGTISALRVYDGKLWVGGGYRTVDDSPNPDFYNSGTWDGSTWSHEVVSGIYIVNRYLVADLDGLGDKLYAACDTEIGSPQYPVRYRSGSSWASVGDVMNYGYVRGIGVLEYNGDKYLVAVGTMSRGSPEEIFEVAIWKPGDASWTSINTAGGLRTYLAAVGYRIDETVCAAVLQYLLMGGQYAAIPTGPDELTEVTTTGLAGWLPGTSEWIEPRQNGVNGYVEHMDSTLYLPGASPCNTQTTEGSSSGA